MRSRQSTPYTDEIYAPRDGKKSIGKLKNNFFRKIQEVNYGGGYGWSRSKQSGDVKPFFQNACNFRTKKGILEQIKGNNLLQLYFTSTTDNVSTLSIIIIKRKSACGIFESCFG